MKCMNYDECGTDDLRPDGPNVHRELTGFDQARSQGGTNHVELREHTGRIMCSGCFEALKATRGLTGVNPAQASLT